MSKNTIQEIERAISTLSSPEFEELCGWFDRYAHPLDTRIESDLVAGRLDVAILRALDDEKNDRVLSI